MEDAKILPSPHGKRMICPVCQRHLPVDEITECDRCGAHIELKMDVASPAL